MTINSAQPSETQELSLRFMRVMDVMFRMARRRMPNQVAGRLPVSQLHLLVLLHNEPGIAQKDVAEYLGITAPAVSTAVREMERYGLIERREHPDDRRLVQLFLSQQGQEMMQEGQKHRCMAFADFLSVLPLEEQRVVVEALERAAVRHKELNSEQ